MLDRSFLFLSIVPRFPNRTRTRARPRPRILLGRSENIKDREPSAALPYDLPVVEIAIILLHLRSKRWRGSAKQRVVEAILTG